jgi:putative endonuclease
MKSARRSFGDRGEDEAVSYLKKNGYRILARNYVSGRREIDIIASKKDILAIVEVKTRTYTKDSFEKYGRAAQAVDADKRRNLLIAARAYTEEHPTNKLLRFDVIEVYFAEGEDAPLLSLHHMPDAFRT